ncbi:MAG: amino acid adenylation domain-containing protein, partial [Proteobacteria bacterium]|nr:amino acid adenylation domain-containing protein [Pseudomonadota bacterium]
MIKRERFLSLSLEEKKQFLLKLKAKVREHTAAGKLDNTGKEVVSGKDRKDETDCQPFPLTDIQESFLVGKYAGQDGIGVGCHIYMEFEEIDLDIGRLNESWNRLVSHHDMLRAVIHKQGQQRILKETNKVQFKVNDLQSLDVTTAENKLESIRAQMSHKRYPVDEWPLFEIRVSLLSFSRYIIHLSIDEWIVDYASLTLILEQWYGLYHQPDYQLPKLTHSFRDFVLANKEEENTPRFKKHLDYWKDKLERIPGGPTLPVANSPSLEADLANSTYKRLAGNLKSDLWQALKAKSHDFGVSPTIAMLELFLELIAHWSDSRHFALVLTFFNRLPVFEGIDDLVGPFMSTNIFIFDDRDEKPFSEKLKQTQSQVWNDMDHSSVSGIRALRELKLGGSLDFDLSLPVVFTSNLANQRGEERPSWFDKASYILTQTPNVYLDHQLSEKNGNLTYSWDIAEAVFAPGMAEAMFEDYTSLLNRMATSDHYWSATSLSDLLTASETITEFQQGKMVTFDPKLPEELIIKEANGSSDQPFPLSDQQQAYLYGRLSGIGSEVSCQVYQELEVEYLDLERLESAWKQLVDHHDMLRTAVYSNGTQQILPSSSGHQIQVTDLNSLDSGQRQEALGQLRQTKKEAVFPLDQAPFCELSITKIDNRLSVIHIRIDMLVADGNSIQLVFKQLFELYNNPQKRLSKTTVSFRDYMLLHQEYKQTAGYKQSLEYWKNKMQRLPSGSDLPIQSGASGATFNHYRLNGSLKQWHVIRDKAKELGVTPGNILLTVYNKVLLAFGDNEPFTTVVVNWNRLASHQDIPKLVGDFTALCWVECRPNELSLAENIRQVHREIENDLACRPVSGLAALRRLNMNQEQNTKSFPIVFTDFMEHNGFVPPVPFKMGYGASKTPQVNLDNISYVDGDTLFFSWDANTEIIDKELITQAFAAYCQILECLVEDKKTWDATDLICHAGVNLPGRHPETNQTRIASAADLTKLERWNDTAVDYPLDSCMHQFIEDQVKKSGSATALVYEDQILSYRELNERANQVAHYLIKLGVGPDSIVGVMMTRSLEMVIGMLGILKAGGAYLPLDPTYPEDRLKFLIEDAGATIVLSQKVYQSRVELFDVQHLLLDCPDNSLAIQSIDNPACRTEPHHLAYVIYTSGSTGKPKGCMLPHVAICNRILWMQEAYQLTANDRVLQKTPFTFDVSVWEFFWPLMTGATMVIARPEGHKDTGYLAELIQAQGVTTCHFVPSMLNFFVKDVKASHCKSLRQVFTSGEALSYNLTLQFLNDFDARLHNLYGPTEAAVDVSYWECHDREDKKIPIGKPIANIQLLVLDENLNQVAVGEKGELHIAGVGLARGYLGRPELTEQIFIRHPFSDNPNARLYKTGDEVRYLEDGNIEYLGRLDFQVKLRGFRIELGEIENVLTEHPVINQAIAMVQDKETDDPRLVTYLVTKRGESITSKEVRNYVKSKLPEYFVPNVVAMLDEFPVTHHGKVDRKLLPWPVNRATTAITKSDNKTIEESSSQETDSKPVVIDSVEEISRKVTAELKSILTLDEINIEEDFFDYGVTSLTLVNLSQQIQNWYEITIPIEVYLDNPTICSLSKYLHEQLKEKAPLAAAQQVERSEPAVRENKTQNTVTNESVGSERYIELQSVGFSGQAYLDRAPSRGFASGSVSLEQISRLLSLLSEKMIKEKPRYLYPSAGGLNAVQLYLAVKENGIEGLGAGTYYYDPRQHSLFSITDDNAFKQAAFNGYYHFALEQSGFAVFFIAQLNAILPVYADTSKLLVTLDSGYMEQLLMSRKQECGVGLMPVEGLDFERIKGSFKLDDGHMYVHCLLGGSATDKVFEEPSPGLKDYLNQKQTGLRDHIVNTDDRSYLDTRDSEKKMAKFKFMLKEEHIAFE